jgi:hypothetical protein
MPYADLLDHFEAVSQRVEDANLSHKLVIGSAHDEGGLAEGSSRAAIKLARSLDGGAARESATMRDALAALAAHHEEAARAHGELAKRLAADVCEPQLRARKDVKHFNVKKIAEGEKLVKELRKAQQRAEDAKNKARQKRLEAETATAHHEKARGDASFNPKQLGSIASKEKSALKDADKAEAEHDAAVAKLDATRASYEQGMSALLGELESQELSRIAEVKRGLTTYVEAHREALDALRKNLDAFDASVQGIHNAADVSAFVAETLAAVENGEDVGGKRRKSIFRRGTTTATSSPMAGGAGSSSPATAAVAATGGGAATAAVAAGAGGGSAASSAAGTSNNGSETGASNTNTNTGGGDNDNDNDNDGGGANAGGSGSDNDNDDSSKADAGAGAKVAAAAGAAFAGAATFMSAAKAKIGGGDGGAEAEPHNDDKDLSAEFQAEAADVEAADSGNPFGDDAAGGAAAAAAAAETPTPEAANPFGDAFAEEAPPAAAPAAAAAPADPFGADPFGDDAGAAAGGAGAATIAAATADAPAGSSDTVLCSARALYDYDSTGPGELSFKEDQMLVIYAKNESGWWEGVVEGTTERGVCPSNYLEEVAQ